MLCLRVTIWYVDEPLKVVYRKTVTSFDAADKVGRELADMLADVYGRSYVEIIEKNDGAFDNIIEEIDGCYAANKSFDREKLDRMVEELTNNV